MFELMRELFQILNDARRRRGSIDFDLNEAEVIIDEGGVVEAIIALQRNVAHRLIEEFMLLANETVASYLEAQEAPALYRIHEEPDILKVAKFEEFISGVRLQPRRAADGAAAAALPEAARADPRQARREADRVPDAADDAEGALRAGEPRPLRARGGELHALHLADPPLSRSGRAPRAARGAARRCSTDGTREEWNEDLPEIARHTSEMERRADDAERELLQWKKVKFMADKVGDEFEGYVTGVAAFGLFVELDRALRRRHGPRVDDGRRLLPLRRDRTSAARREYAEDLSARRQSQGAGPPRQHGRAADRSGPG